MNQTGYRNITIPALVSQKRAFARTALRVVCAPSIARPRQPRNHSIQPVMFNVPFCIGLRPGLQGRGVRHVIIDEVQRIPELLNEVQFLIERRAGVQFLLSSSSARKLKRSHANLLAGRAVTRNLFPLTSGELVTVFPWAEAFNTGLCRLCNWTVLRKTGWTYFDRTWIPICAKRLSWKRKCGRSGPS